MKKQAETIEMDSAAELDSSSTPDYSDFSFLPKDLAANLGAQGIVKPTEIQAHTIPAAMTGRDILAQSQTGSGKTLAFGIPVGLQLKKGKRGTVRALVLTPTRELATQVATVLSGTLGSLGLRTLAVTGGASYQRQKRALSDGTDIVVGTPGRICDLLAQGSLMLSTLEMFVLDEVDQMLDVGFADDLKKIRDFITSPVQTLFFSATLSSDIRALTRKMLRDPLEIHLTAALSKAPATIDHGYLEVLDGAEHKALINTLLFHNPERALVFCKTRQECGDLAHALSERGFSAAALHGDLNQQERNTTLEKFREKRLQYLVSTNVAARGIDVQDLALVVNFSVPFDVETYTHRVGRTGRNGALGQAWTIVTPRTSRGYEFIMRKMHLMPKAIPVPSSTEILNRVLDSHVEELKKEREAVGNRTVDKAVTRVLAALSDEERATILKELLLRRMEKMETFYTDGVVPQRQLVRLDIEPRKFAARSEGKPSFSKEGPRSFKRDGKPSFGKGESTFRKDDRPFAGKGGSPFKKSGPSSFRKDDKPFQKGGDRPFKKDGPSTTRKASSFGGGASDGFSTMITK